MDTARHEAAHSIMMLLRGMKATALHLNDADADPVCLGYCEGTGERERLEDALLARVKELLSRCGKAY